MMKRKRNLRCWDSILRDSTSQREVLPANVVYRYRAGRTGSAAGVERRDCRVRGHRRGGCQSAGSRGGRASSHSGPGFRGAFQPAAADFVRRGGRAGSAAQGGGGGTQTACAEFRDSNRRVGGGPPLQECGGTALGVSADP